MRFKYSDGSYWGSIKGKVLAISVAPATLHTEYGTSTMDDVRIVTDQGRWRFTGEGDCCTVVTIEAPDPAELEAMVGQTVTPSEEAESEREGDYGEVHDTHRYILTGERSSVTIVLHAEHNGYYGGNLSPIYWPDEE